MLTFIEFFPILSIAQQTHTLCKTAYYFALGTGIGIAGCQKFPIATSARNLFSPPKQFCLISFTPHIRICFHKQGRHAESSKTHVPENQHVSIRADKFFCGGIEKNWSEVTQVILLIISRRARARVRKNNCLIFSWFADN